MTDPLFLAFTKAIERENLQQVIQCDLLIWDVQGPEGTEVEELPTKV